MMPYKNDSLFGKKILVTGASSGIGRYSSIVLAECGAELVICARNKDRLNETRLMLRNHERHSSELINFSSVNQTAEEFEKITKKYGVFDGVFHSAGVSLLKPIKLTTDKDVENLFASSLNTAVAIGKVFSKKSSLKDGGSLVLMSSVSAHAGQQGMTLYSATKSAIEGMARSLACELSNRAIRVNCIAAGGVETEMHERMMGTSHQDVIDAYKKMHLLGFGKPKDIAGLVVYLMSDISRWMTGTAVVLDGGYLAK